jgi:hypothetical protein
MTNCKYKYIKLVLVLDKIFDNYIYVSEIGKHLQQTCFIRNSYKIKRKMFDLNKWTKDIWSQFAKKL